MEQTVNMPCIIGSFPCGARDISGLYFTVAWEDACSAIFDGLHLTGRGFTTVEVAIPWKYSKDGSSRFLRIVN
jgi:hypothetical protein